LDKFANTIEINFDLAANAQVKTMEAIEQRKRDIGFWDLQNASDFMHNGHALANLERFKVTDSALANGFKNYLDAAELISSQMKTIID
jgi:hypothetical protein